MLTGLLSCIEGLRSERRYRQARLTNRVKMASKAMSTLEQQYNELLTPFAYDCLVDELKLMGLASERHATSDDSCSCRFFRCMMMPCRHMLVTRESHDLDLFVPDLIAPRWTKDYNSCLNLRPFTQSAITVSEATPSRKKKTLTSNEKYKLANKTFQRMATLMADQGMQDFEKKLDLMKSILSNWEENRNCFLLSDV